MSAQRVLVICICGFCVATGAIAGSVPVAGSPGDVSSLALIGDTCPTFSWGEVEAARSYELVVYRIGEDVEEATPVLRQTLPGSVGSWTPSLDRCLERGGQYAWSVRALTADGGRTPWSEASLFEISPELSIREVEQALRVLHRYLGAEDEAMEEAGRAPAAVHPAGPSAPRQRRQPSDSRGSALGARSEPGLSASLDAPSPAVTTVLPGGYALSIDGDFDLGRFMFKDGVPFLHNYDGGASDGRNTALGAAALQSVTPGTPNPWSGLYNTAFGFQALRDAAQGSFNTAVGHNALIQTSMGANNTGVGSSALGSNTTGHGNTAVGHGAAGLTNGSHNTALGASATRNNTSGSRNTALGAYAAWGAYPELMTGSDNTVAGYDSLKLNSTGSFNTGVGVDTLKGNTTGSDNTAVGAKASTWNSEGTANTAVGMFALHRNHASSNTAVGYKAMFGLDQEEPAVPTTGEENTALGFRALEQVTTGSKNTAIGQRTLYDNLRRQSQRRSR